MNEIKKEDLLRQAKICRLKLDLGLIEKGIEENKEVAAEEKDNFLKKIGKGIGNSVKKSRTEALQKALAKDQAKMVEINPDKVEIKQEDFRSLCEKVLNTPAKKAAFGLYYLASEDFEYEEGKETNESLSEALFGDKESLSRLSNELNANFRSIAGALFSGMKFTDEAKVAIGKYFETLENPAKGECALCKAKDALGEKADSVAAVLAVLLCGNAGLPYCNDEEKSKTALLGISKESFQAVLALKATLIQEEKKGWSNEEKEANVKGILRVFADFSYLARVAYLAYGEKKEPSEEKIKGVNAFLDQFESLLK